MKTTWTHKGGQLYQWLRKEARSHGVSLSRVISWHLAEAKTQDRECQEDQERIATYEKIQEATQ